MSKKIVLIALAMVFALIVGCNDAPSADNAEDATTNIEMLSDTLKQHLVKQDSLSKELLQKIDTLTKELNSAKAETESLRSSIKKEDNPKLLWDILPLAISIISLLLALLVAYTTRNAVEEEKVYGILKKEFNKIGLTSDICKSIQRLTSNPNQQKSAKVQEASINYEVESRLASLEKEITELKRTHTPNIAVQSKKPLSPTVLYANMNSQEYFTSVVSSKQSTCVFVIELSPQNRDKGYFNIISLDQIKQRNGWEPIVTYSGNCVFREAKGFKINRNGECEKLSDGTWKVTRNLEITIY